MEESSHEAGAAVEWSTACFEAVRTAASRQHDRHYQHDQVRMDSTSKRGSHDGGNGNDGNADAVERMRRAIRAASDGSGSRTELQAAARELVTKLRAERARPEQMLIRIKEILAESGILPDYTPDNRGPAGRANGSVYRDVIAWSIRFYYADGEGNDGPSAP